MPDAVCLGELLIDFVSTTADTALADCLSFQKAPGGAPANVAAGLAKLGVSSGFVGKVGDDPFGALLVDTLRAVGVDTSRLVVGRRVRTSLAFVATRGDGRKDIAFWRHPGADLLLSVDELDFDYLRAARAFHFGSVSLSHFPARDATLAAAHAAHAAGLLVSYDPNLRLPLWDSPEDAREWIWQAMRFATVVKVADEEWEFITGVSDFDRGAAQIRAEGPQLVVQTCGAFGCRFATDFLRGDLPAFPARVVDTLGAGDAFVAGMLQGLLTHNQPVAHLTAGELSQIMTFANACGALATESVGAIPALPDRDRAESLARSAPRAEI